MCGVKTNVVVAVEIGERYEGDIPRAERSDTFP
jgi:hypothetical protein